MSSLNIVIRLIFSTARNKTHEDPRLPLSAVSLNRSVRTLYAHKIRRAQVIAIFVICHTTETSRHHGTLPHAPSCSCTALRPGTAALHLTGSHKQQHHSMASPASLKPSAASTPEITITEQEVTGEELNLPAPMALELPRHLTFHLPDSQKAPAVELHPMLVIPKGAVDSISDDGVCTIPKSTQPITIPSRGVVETLGDDGKLSSSVPIAPSPVALKQRPKILSELRRSTSTTHLGHLFHHPKNTTSSNPSTTGEKATTTTNIKKGSGSNSPLPDSPDVQDLFKKHNKQTCPDLEAVSRALNSLRAQSRPGDPNNEYVTSLTRLATSLELSRSDSKKALIQAMQARDAGRNEICRSLCLSIVQNSHADVDTRVYSYNILSTMASPGQAMNYLTEALKLVEEHADSHPECEKLLGVIALLKDGAIERDGGVVSESSAVALGKLCELEMPPTIPKEVGCPSSGKNQKGSLEVPRGTVPSGMLTPKTEKILGWAADSTPTKIKGGGLKADSKG